MLVAFYANIKFFLCKWHPLVAFIVPLHIYMIKVYVAFVKVKTLKHYISLHVIPYPEVDHLIKYSFFILKLIRLSTSRAGIRSTDRSNKPSIE